MKLGVGALAGLLFAVTFPRATKAQRPELPAGERAQPSATISMALVDVPLVQALETLSQQARMNLVWQQATLGGRAGTRVNCRFDRVSPEVLLGCITKSAGLDYVRLSSGTYVVISAAEQTVASASLGGRVLDAASGAPLPQARVQLAELSTTVLSTDDGGFSFPQLAPGQYELVVRAVGYRPYRERFSLAPGAARPLRLALVRTETLTRPIIVNGVRAGALSASLGTTAVADSAVARTLTGPALFLPGAVAPLGASRRDGVGDLHLQGGDVGEHPWRIDGIPLYDVTTLSGLLGVISPLAIDQLTVRRSGFRAREGSFATGVIDLRHAVNENEGVARADVHVDPLAVLSRVETPVSFGELRGGVALSARTGVWQWTAPPALTRALRHWSTPDPVLLSRLNGLGAIPGMEGLDAASFATSIGNDAVRLNDFHLASRLRAGVSHTLETSAFVSTHGISYDGVADDGAGHQLATRDRYDWRTLGAQLSHQWLLGTRVRQRVQLRGSRHALEHSGAMSMNGAALTPLGAREDNTIAEAALNAEWRVNAGLRTELSLGAEVAHTKAHLDLSNRVLRPLAYRASVTRGALVADVTRQLDARHFIDAGVRVTQLQNGSTYAEPRLSIRGEQALTAGPLTWRLAGGGYHQFVNQFDVASTMPVAFVPSVRFWLPSDGRASVAQSWHTSGELAFAPASGWELRAEVYARWHPSLPMFDYGSMYDDGAASAVLPVAGTAFVRNSSGRAYGGGVRVIRDGALRGRVWRTEVGYDGGRSVRRFPSRFDGNLQPTPWMEPHRVLVSTEVHPMRDLVVATRLRGVWGRPWALRQAYYDLFGAAPMSSSLPISMPGNMVRPAVIDVDVGATYARDVRGARLEMGVSVMNAIGRRNVLDYSLRRTTNGAYDMVPRFMPFRQPAFTLRIGR